MSGRNLDAWKLLGLIIKELFGKRHRTKMPGSDVASELQEEALVLAEEDLIDPMSRLNSTLMVV